ncbi:MAG: SDR family oxidoreductase [Gemmatimonadetes bacterium]|nr:SDR family oxidoreductase [Gemmatimonadota bacterium]
MSKSSVLVTGATGYIGGRLVPWLLDAGYDVRCLVRDRRKLTARPWADDPRVTAVEGDAMNEEDVMRAMQGCSAAYYMIHSMMVVGSEYRERDRRLATTFANAAGMAGVERILYLGGLGETGEGLSEHLESRRETEEALASGPAKLTVLRAAMIIGSGSASFEILRYLVERLPVMVTPRWVQTEAQPIGVRNVLHYLVACLDTPETAGRTLDIGGPDVFSYEKIMQIMAEELGVRKRLIMPVPVLTPKLSSLWIHLITPLSAKIARPLAEGLKNRVVARNNDAAELMPQELLTVRESIQMALGRMRDRDVETSWSDAGVMPGDPDWAGGKVFVDEHRIAIAAPADSVYRAVCRIGGGQGYYSASWLWQLRGWMDRLVGGPGLRRGRRDPIHISYGDALDFWRVRGVEPGRALSLRAEMKLPGEAQLDFAILPRASAGASPHGNAACELVQTARFMPRGLFGLLYWYAVQPFHGVVFRGMLHGIERAAIADARAGYEESHADRQAG